MSERKMVPRDMIPGDTTSEKVTTLVAAASYWSYSSGQIIMQTKLHSIAQIFADLTHPLAFVWLCIQTSHWLWKNLLKKLFAPVKKGDSDA